MLWLSAKFSEDLYQARLPDGSGGYLEFEFPRRLYTEIDDSGRETRKVHVFADGRREYADANHETVSIFLAHGLLSDFDQLFAYDKDYETCRINQEEFEKEWKTAVDQTSQ